MRATVLLILFLFQSLGWAFDAQTVRLSQSFETFMLEDSLHSNYSKSSEKNPWGFNLSYNFIDDPLIVINKDRSQNKGSIIKKYHSVDMGFNRFFLLSGKYRSQLQVRTSYNRSEVNGREFADMGDTNVGLKVNFYESEKVAFSVTPFVDLPTGHSQKFMSNDSLGLGVLSGVEYHPNDRFHLFSNFGYKHSENATFLNIDLVDRFVFGLGGWFDLNERISFGIEWKGEFSSSFKKDSNPTDLIGGFKFRLADNLNSLLGVGIGASDFTGVENTHSNDLRVFAALKWRPGSTEKEIVEVEKIVEVEVPRKVAFEKALLVLRGVKFEYNKDRLTTKSKAILNYVAEVVAENQDILKRIYVEGHTDSVGSRKYNEQLSFRRSERVARYLSKKVPELRTLFRPVAFSEDYLKVAERDQADMAMNRRVEFSVVYQD